MILQGGKVRRLPDNELLFTRYSTLALRMHAAHYVAAEPQCYLVFQDYEDLDRKYMGKTRLHPISTALFNEAEQIRSIAAQKGDAIAPFEVLGLNWSKRQASKDGRAFEIDAGKVGVFTPGDHACLYQAMNIISSRLSQSPDVHFTAPLIIQNTDHFWEGIFNTGSKDWSEQREELKKRNIHYSSGPAETAELLADLPFSQKIQPSQIDFDLGGYSGGADPDQAFATTDQLKFDQTLQGHSAIGAQGLIKKLIDVLGPFVSPQEESYSYEANAEEEKMKAVYDLLRKLGREKVTKFFSDHGYKDLNKVNIIVHDGGLGFCLENAKGERRIDLFTGKHFPNSIHKLNPSQMSPGVELAYLKRTDGLEITMERLQQRVEEIVAEDPRFTKKDLKAYDTSLFVSCQITSMLDAIDAGEEYEPVKLGVVSVFDAQILQVADKPKFSTGKRYHVAETENYLIPQNGDKTRSEDPSWVLNGPNVASYNLLRRYVGAQGEMQPIRPGAAPRRVDKDISMGILGSPELIIAPGASPDFRLVKAELKNRHGIATQQGPRIWRDFKGSAGLTLKIGSAGHPTNPAYLENMRTLLDRSSVLYFGPREKPLSDRQKVEAYLLFIKAMVRNQVFNRTEIVADTQAAADVLRLLEHKQMLGLVGQQTGHLVTVSSGFRDSARKIADKVKAGIPYITPVSRHFYSDGQVEHRECMTITGYASATNCNKATIDNLERVCYLAAINGFSLKTGGGNDGGMKAMNDCFLKGKAELLAKGYDFPNELVNIQCVDTEAIEKPYEGGGIYRCHPDIESRKADLQACDLSFAGPGGIGTDEEILGRMYSCIHGITKPKDTPFYFLNFQMDSPRGKVGAYDPYRDIFSEAFLSQMNMGWVMTPEGLIDQACALRASRRNIATIPVSALRRTLSNDMNTASYALNIKSFLPPYEIYLGPAGQLPYAKPEVAARNVSFS